MNNKDALTAMAERHAATICEAVLAAVPAGAKPTREQWKALMSAAAGAAFELGFRAGERVWHEGDPE